MQQEKKFYIGEGDDKVLLAFNINVVAEIQAVYKSVSAWVGLLEDDDENPQRNGEPDMKAFLTGFTLMLNEGIAIENDEGADKKPFTERQVGRMIGLWGKDVVNDAMRKAITASSDTGEEQPKNGSSKTKSTKA